MTQPRTTAPTPPRLRRRLLAALRLRRVELIYLAGLVAFAALAVSAHLYAYFGWDVSAERALQQLPVPGLAAAMRFVSFFANTWHPFALTAATCLAFFPRRRRTEAAGLLLCAGVGDLINVLTKFVVARPRPSALLVNVYRPLHTESFPSGHVILAAAIAAVLSSALVPGWVWLPWLLTSLVMLGRVYVGAHNPLDVTAGLGAGMLIGGVLEVLLR